MSLAAIGSITIVISCPQDELQSVIIPQASIQCVIGCHRLNYNCHWLPQDELQSVIIPQATITICHWLPQAQLQLSLVATG